MTPRSLFLMEDLLWSDPSNEPGSERDCEPNHSRGAGTKFGSMVIKEWLKKNGLKALVRSHQCVPKGWDMIDCGEGTSCWTVFSASDYDCGGNDGAVLIFEGEGSGSSPRVGTPRQLLSQIIPGQLLSLFWQTLAISAIRCYIASASLDQCCSPPLRSVRCGHERAGGWCVSPRGDAHDLHGHHGVCSRR